MKISHVIRGEDHLSNTPKHILLFRALGEAEPLFAHLPLILNPDRTKMSKRKSQTARRRLHRRGLHPRGPGQLPGPARLVDRQRGGDPGRSTRSRPGSASSMSRRAARSSTASGSSGSTASGSGACRRPSSWTGCGRSSRWRPTPGRIDRMPADAELEALVPLVQERLPVLGAIGDLVDFLFVDRLELDPALLVPKRWDAATTLDGLSAARAALAGIDAGRRSSPTGWRSRCGPWPRRAAGRPVTCSWRSASRSPAGPRPRRCSRRSAALGRERTIERLDAAIVVAGQCHPTKEVDAMNHADRPGLAGPLHRRPGRPTSRTRSGTCSAPTRATATTPGTSRSSVARRSWPTGSAPAAIRPSATSRARSGPTTSRTSSRAIGPWRSARATTTRPGRRPARTYHNCLAARVRRRRAVRRLHRVLQPGAPRARPRG